MKQSTKALLLVVLAQATTSGAWMCMHLASMWLEIGHGLNPYISLPLAGVFGLVPYIVYSLWFESDSPTFDLETIEMPLNPKRSKPIDSGSSDFPKDVF